ncbi:MAG: LysR family transcriptional regulator [Bryobacteraceae bacterium]|nr:LysR family transcriptional regulator [Bryobacteraceae bacterium]
MNVEHLKLFRDVAQTRSISRGASLNGVTQSAASQHVQELEKMLEVELLDRSRRPLALTPAGRLYYDLCRDVLRRHEEFAAALGRLKSDVEGRVRVASIYSVGLSEMSRIEEEYARAFPLAVLEIEYLRPERVREAIETDRADLGLISYPEPSREIAVIPWREEEMVLAVAASHRLAHRDVVAASEIAGEAFVAFDEDLPIRHEVDRFLREQGVMVDLVMHFDVIQMIKEAVALGSGVSILPRRVMRPEIKQGRLAAVALKAPGLVRPVGIIHRKRKKFNPAAQAFLDLLRNSPEEEPEAIQHAGRAHDSRLFAQVRKSGTASAKQSPVESSNLTPSK